MNFTERYVPCKVAVVDGEIIPFWLIKSKKEDSYGMMMWTHRYNGEKVELIDYAWDLKLSKPVETVIVEIKNSSKDINVGGEFYYKDGYDFDGPNKLIPVKIIDIVFERYDSLYKKGQYFIENYKYLDFKFEAELFYELREFKAKYILSNNKTTEYPSQDLYKII